MDGECASVLPRVCELLATPNCSVPDDTSLEKLLDWFTTLAKSGISLLESSPCLLSFITTVVGNPAAEPSILTFALKLTGLIAATEDGFKVFLERSVLDLAFDSKHWQDEGLWCDPCIRIGWVQGFRSMLQHRMAVCFFMKSGAIKRILELQTDKSLFVASAAHQLLTHILTVSQSFSTTGSNGATEKQADDISSRSFIADVNKPGITMETHRDFTYVVTEVCEYIKRRMVPREGSELGESQQVLTLLASLLTQGGPDLHSKLLINVTNSLEELVAADFSQLTHPLMKVLLARNSSCSDAHIPDSRLSSLSMLMLNKTNVSDVLPAAVAYLCSEYSDDIYKTHCARILLLPLDILTGVTILNKHDTVEQQRFSMGEQLKHKSVCITAICISLKHLSKIALLPSDCQPCSPASIVSAVLSLLRLCGAGLSVSSTGCVEVLRNITGSGKVQKCALETLSELSGGPGVKVMLAEVFGLLVDYLNEPESEPTVLHKSYQALVQWLRNSDLSSITDQLRQDLMQVLRKRVCDMRWEVRDSTMEFLGHLAGIRVLRTEAGEEWDASRDLLGESGFTSPLLVEGLRDPESYVRASAISALAQTVAHTWHKGAALAQNQESTVTQLLKILSDDAEGFARRAVLQYFIIWFSSHPSPTSCLLLMESVRTVLSRGSADLDWEVKVHTLDLSELLMDQAFSCLRGYTKRFESHPRRPHPYSGVTKHAYTLHAHSGTRTQHAEWDWASVLQSLVERGVLSVLLSGLVDCDRPVGLKACRLLMKLRDTMFSQTRAAGGDMKTAPGVFWELPGESWVQEITSLQNGARKVNTADGSETAEEGQSVEGHTARISVYELIKSLDLDERLDILTQSSDHVHNSLLSLLQDLLTASSPHANNSQPELEVIVDCY